MVLLRGWLRTQAVASDAPLECGFREIRPKTLLGEPIVEICRAAQQLKCDLVIAGTRGLSGQTYFVGGTASR
jgi:nucleotide-binding universal stress UspA family protein